MLFNMLKNWSALPSIGLSCQREKFERSLEKLDQLPSLPDTALLAMALANNDDATIGDFVALIKRDGSLTAAILKLANSFVYRSTHPVTTIHNAVVRIGIRSCSRTIASFAIKAAFHPASARQKVISQVLWRHSFFTASICSHLNSELHLGYHGEEFSAGLLHDVGRLLIASIDVDAFATVDAMDFQESAHLPHKERSLLGIDHCELGATYARRSRLPSAVVNSILHHHCCEEANEDADLVTLVSFADELTNHAQRCRRISNFDFEESKSFWALGHGHSQQWMSNFPSILARVVRRSIRETRGLLKCQE